MKQRAEDVLKDKLATTVAILAWELCDMWGHASAKTADGKRFFLRHLRPPAEPGVPVDDVLEFDLNGNLLSGLRNKPDEIFFHTCSYKRRPGVGAVIHCHPLMAIALVATGRKIIPIYQHAQHFGKGVPVSPWLYGTMREHAEKALKVMGNSSALMIKGHGALVVGETLEEACMTMVRLERSARMILAAAALGNPAPISPSAAHRLRSIYAGPATNKVREGLPKSIGHATEWRYYESLVKKGERWSRL